MVEVEDHYLYSLLSEYVNYRSSSISNVLTPLLVSAKRRQHTLLLDVTSDNAQTALHWAVRRGQKGMVKCIMENSVIADELVAVRDDLGRTAVHHAARIGCWESIELMLNAVLSEYRQQEIIELQDAAGWTALDLASHCRHPRACLSLDRYKGRNPAHVYVTDVVHRREAVRIDTSINGNRYSPTTFTRFWNAVKHRIRRAPETTGDDTDGDSANEDSGHLEESASISEGPSEDGDRETLCQSVSSLEVGNDEEASVAAPIDQQKNDEVDNQSQVATGREGTPVATGNEGTQVVTGKEGTQVATSKEGTQVATSNEGTQVATGKKGPQVATSKEGPQVTTIKEDFQVASGKEGPQGATSKEGPQVTTSKEVPQVATSKEGPQVATSNKGPQLAISKENHQLPKKELEQLRESEQDDVEAAVRENSVICDVKVDQPLEHSSIYQSGNVTETTVTVRERNHSKCHLNTMIKADILQQLDSKLVLNQPKEQHHLTADHEPSDEDIAQKTIDIEDLQNHVKQQSRRLEELEKNDNKLNVAMQRIEHLERTHTARRYVWSDEGLPKSLEQDKVANPGRTLMLSLLLCFLCGFSNPAALLFIYTCYHVVDRLI